MPPRKQASAPTRQTSLRSRTTLPPSTTQVTAAHITPDELATEMSAKLTITKSKGKERLALQPPAAPRVAASRRSHKSSLSESDTDKLARAVGRKLVLERLDERPPLTEEQECAEAMRSVNAASKALSGVVESGWKASNRASTPAPAPSRTLGSGMQDPTNTQVDKLARSVRDGLAVLRDLRPGDVDIERAASSVLGKLVSLEHYQVAFQVMQDMHPHLHRLYHGDCPSATEGRLTTSSTGIAMISLPLPYTTIPIPNDNILTLISTYLAHALTIVAWITFTQDPEVTSSKTSDSEISPINQLADAIHNTPTLLHWLPHLRSLSSKHLDGIFTRAYTALTKASSLPSPTQTCANSTYRVRHHALLLLLATSPGALKPNLFWNQAVKFTVAFVKAVARPGAAEEAKNKATASVLHAFTEVARRVKDRPDTELWTHGPEFIAFCDYWMEFAQRANDVTAITEISKLITLAASGSGTGSRSLQPGYSGPVQENTRGSEDLVDRPLFSVAQTAKVCAICAEATVLLERTQSTQDGSEPTTMQDALSALTHAQALLSAAYGATDSGDVDSKVAEKVWRAIERMRKASCRNLNSNVTSQASGHIIPLVEGIVRVLASVLTVTKTGHADILTSTLDTLFTLAKTGPPDADGPAFKHLCHAHSLLVDLPEAALGRTDRANFLRCVSGAFHNIGATLYQLGNHAHAIRFFERGCSIAEDALRVYQAVGADTNDRDGEEHWTLLRDQLYKRWEILAVSFIKIGNRKMAYETFRKSIAAFPFVTSGLAEHAHMCSISTLFNCDAACKRLADLVDRMTYMGLCDLFLPAETVSVGSLLPLSSPEARVVIGALLERQADGLTGSRWKPPVRRAIGHLLQNAMEVYLPQEAPIQRSRAVLAYLANAVPSDDGTGPTLEELEELVHDTESVLQSEDLSGDAPLDPYRAQHRAMLKLRLAHVVHQRVQPSEFCRVTACAREACSVLKGILSPAPRSGKIMSPRKPAARKATAKKAPTRVKSRVAKTAATVPVTPRTRKSTAHLHQAPIPRLSLGGPPTFEDVAGLLDLLHSNAHLLGLLGQVVTKVQVLHVGRRISEQHMESSADDYVQFSTALAHEYVILGKTARAANIYSHTWASMEGLHVADESRVLFLLRYAESLIAVGNVLQSSASYCEAQSLAQTLGVDERGLPTAQRILTRAGLLERAATAASTFASIQYTRDDPVASINGLLQALRLWNRAYDTLSRLEPTPASKKVDEYTDNPFLTAQDAGDQSTQTTQTATVRAPKNLSSLGGIWWRVAEGLLHTLFSLTQAYVARGSPREAEFFAQQAKDFSIALGMPAMTSRALARLGEIYLHSSQLDECLACLTEATTLVANTAGPDAAEVWRLRAEYNRVSANGKETHALYEEAIAVLEELEHQFVSVDDQVGSRKFISSSPQSPRSSSHETLTPSLLFSILRQNIWLLHAEGGEYQELLERVRALPPTAEIKAEENALLAKLSLGDVYGRLQADMFLSSLAESAITLPMGMRRDKLPTSPSTQGIITMLNNAEKLFWSDLTLVARRGNVFHVRDAAVSLALIRAFQDTLGKARPHGPTLAACLLDKSTAITLRREILEVVQFKFDSHADQDDLQWPLITPNGSPLPPVQQRQRSIFASGDLEDTDARGVSASGKLHTYWKSLANKYQGQVYDAKHLSISPVKTLPQNWTVVSISVSEDKNTMFVTRQRSNKEPLIFYIPLKGRRENEDDEHLTFDSALAEFDEIIKLSYEGNSQAASVRNDREARAAWWADRSALDKRLKQLLHNIEFCWLGAFKTILTEPRNIAAGVLDDLRTRLEKIFRRNIVLRDKKQSIAVRLDDALLECFACLSPKSRDEELEDLVYFILDLYQFHGIPVATAEVDIDQVVIDFRTALEEHGAKWGDRMVPQADSHMFLILDKNVQGIPWESIPILRGRSISRIPSIDFLLDRVHYVQSVQGEDSGCADRLTVDPRKTFFVLNPSGDLKNTEDRFIKWLQDMQRVGWTGTVGQVPSELQLVDALAMQDLVIYFGHGGAEQYIRSRKVRHLPRCAATMLWGCSSGALKEMGAFDRTGTPYNYMLAGCPTLVANLWDVTDRDIDKFSQSVFDKMRLDAEHVKAWQPGRKVGTSIVTAVAQSRDACKLTYLIGAAPVVYGIPFYL